MSDRIKFTLDGREVEAAPGESIWEVAKREGTLIPHLCHKDAPGYRSDGNCRACMVEIEGERVLAASCIREPRDGMVVNSQNDRSTKARRMVMEMLVADQPGPEEAHDKSSHLWDMAAAQGVSDSRFPKIEKDRVPLLDDSHVAMKVNLDACIHCNLCVRACREVQVNDVIGMAGRGHDAQIIFDMDDPMGASTCVACGECVQACPTGALMEAAALDADQRGDSKDYDREVNSVCPYCGVGCQLSFKIKQDESGKEHIAWVDGVEGPANENRLCVKGRFGFDYVDHPHRLTKPLIRREDAPEKGLNVDPANPWTHFREATWEEALDAAAMGLADLRSLHGGKAVAGFGSAKCSNEEAYLFQKLIRQGFKHNNVDHCTRLCHASSVAALMENVGSGAVTATFNEIENADVAIVIGANPTENHPVAATYFKQFSKRGGELIVMDPRGQGLKRHATHMLQFRPGTDVAMLNGIMNVIVEEKLYDRQYIEGFTEGFFEFRDHIRAFKPERMAELCGIPADTLREVARTFARARSGMIFWGMGVSQHIHGTDNARCLISLALLCGHVGRPGTGLHPLRGQNNVQGASDAGLIPQVLPDYQSVADPEVRELFKHIWQGTEIDEKPGLTVVEIVDAMYRGEIKGMYVLGENPAMSDPDVEHARKALAHLDHLVVQDIFLTETANFADVILPASAWPEKTGTVTNTNRQVQMGRKALNAPGEAREDWWIIVELARRLGLDWDYDTPRMVFNEMKMSMRSLHHITWQRLENENAVMYPSLSNEDPGQPVVFGDGFPRRAGRAKFTPARVTPPAEVPDERFPMILTTGRQLEHWHTGSMTRRTTVLDAVEPEANASLHPKTLRAMGI
ncbi:MAG: formate dehydrogenase subunit alpha, partial [Pseudomonadota bacterium]